MVDHSHLSAGNSEISPSRDLYAEFGVSKPNSMVESEPLRLAMLVDSDDSSVNGGSNENVSLDNVAALQDVFKAAQHFCQKDRLEAVSILIGTLPLFFFIYGML